MKSLQRQQELEFSIEEPNPSSRKKYFEIVRDVFSSMGPIRIRKNMERFNDETRFYVFKINGEYASILFLSPVEIGPLVIGGIGGVATRVEYRKMGLAGRLIEKAIDNTKGVYPALLVWTRIPRFFAKFGFKASESYFEKERGGSRPMFYYHVPEEKIASLILKRLPRVYF